jgi:cupin 2 domain-containing protein
MPTTIGHLFPDAPVSSPANQENIETLLATKAFRIERIASHGQPSPEGFWYDQPTPEWVALLQGTATLRFSDEDNQIDLKAGDYLLIPAHRQHRVEHTSKDALWLAIHTA